LIDRLTEILQQATINFTPKLHANELQQPQISWQAQFWGGWGGGILSPKIAGNKFGPTIDRYVHTYTEIKEVVP